MSKFGANNQSMLTRNVIGQRRNTKHEIRSEYQFANLGGGKQFNNVFQRTLSQLLPFGNSWFFLNEETKNIGVIILINNKEDRISNYKQFI